jgi:hypothetical protein
MEYIYECQWKQRIKKVLCALCLTPNHGSICDPLSDSCPTPHDPDVRLLSKVACSCRLNVKKLSATMDQHCFGSLYIFANSRLMWVNALGPRGLNKMTYTLQSRSHGLTRTFETLHTVGDGPCNARLATTVTMKIGRRRSTIGMLSCCVRSVPQNRRDLGIAASRACIWL